MQSNAMRAHFAALNKLYGVQSLVNLVNQKGYEKPVKDAYERYIDEVRSLCCGGLCNNQLDHLARLAVC
jgi:SacI homology domain